MGLKQTLTDFLLVNSMEKKSIKRLKVYDIEDCHQLLGELFPKSPASFLGKFPLNLFKHVSI